MKIKEQILLVKNRLNISQIELVHRTSITYIAINGWGTANVQSTKKNIFLFKLFYDGNNIKIKGD